MRVLDCHILIYMGSDSKSMASNSASLLSNFSWPCQCCGGLADLHIGCPSIHPKDSHECRLWWPCYHLGCELLYWKSTELVWSFWRTRLNAFAHWRAWNWCHQASLLDDTCKFGRGIWSNCMMSENITWLMATFLCKNWLFFPMGAAFTSLVKAETRYTWVLDLDIFCADQMRGVVIYN